ncbi:hypothetical protein H4219_000552 [Mycoemilia scoparia]|uniref:Vacuolar protein sorting-associated protein 54 n=1 Tax=Mycoemilia scoparia TaxID=417184 RepID=A0A9W8DRC8_9FUNG|nr:hypothetical protein H4219_000552 [Mycoemilia scoparia]
MATSNDNSESVQSNRAMGLNSIASLTNDPNKHPTKIHKSELPSVPSTHYPRIGLKNFEGYLEKVEKAHETYEVNRQTSYRVTTSELTKYRTAMEDAESVLQDASRTYSMSSGTMVERLKSFDGIMSESGFDTISELGGNLVVSNLKPNQKQAPDIDSIPTIFFEKDFDIKDPTTFELVIRLVGNEKRGSDIFSPNTSVDANGSIHQTLSSYLDITESYFAREISHRSPSLFAALSTLKELHTETELALQQIKVLRRQMSELDEKQCQPGLALIHIKRNRSRLHAIQSEVELLTRANTMITAIEDMGSLGDVVGALEMIIEMQNMTNTDSSSNKSAVKSSKDKVVSNVSESWAFGYINQKLTNAMSSIANTAQQSLVQCIMYDMESFLAGSETGNVPTGMSREESSWQKLEMHREDLRALFVPLFRGLVTAGKGPDAIQAYRARMRSEGDRLLEQVFPNEFPHSSAKSSFGDVTFQKSLHMAVKALEFDDYIDLLKSQFQRIGLVFAHFDLVKELANDTICKIAEEEERQNKDCEHRPKLSSISLSDQHQLVFHELSNAIDAFANISQSHCTKILSYRADQNTNLGLPAFIQVFSLVWDFIQQLKTSNAKMSYGLKSLLTSQGKAFLNNFHSQKTRQLCLLIENEQWSQAEVPVDFQSMVNEITGKEIDKESLPMLASKNDEKQVAELVTEKADQPHQQGSLLYVGDKSFPMVGCSLMLIKMIVEYIECSLFIKTITMDVVQRLIDVLKVFNSRTCQVVLGAGAMQSAGLKNISAKHIALASQALKLVVLIIPHIKQKMQLSLLKTQFVLLDQFDQTSQDYLEHQNELFQKLVQIMTERADAHCAALEGTKWEGTELVTNTVAQETNPSPTIVLLTREIRKLSKVLGRYLSPEDFTSVVTSIFDMYEGKLTKSILSIQSRLKTAQTSGGKRLAIDVRFFISKITSIDSCLNKKTENLGKLASELESMLIQPTTKESPRPDNEKDPGDVVSSEENHGIPTEMGTTSETGVSPKEPKEEEE